MNETFRLLSKLLLIIFVVVILLFTYFFYEKVFVVLVVAITTYIAYHSQYKYAILSVLGVCIVTLLLAIYSGNDKSKLPLAVPVDFSKKGTVYETNFQAPWNSWGSEVNFDLVVGYFSGYKKLTEEQQQIDVFLRMSELEEDPCYKDMMAKNKYFKLKVTLSPLGLASDDVTIWAHRISDNKSVSEDPRKELTDGKKIEFVVFLPLYGGNNGWGGKTIMIADLQRLRNYHIRVESLEDVELPNGVKTGINIDNHNTKH